MPVVRSAPHSLHWSGMLERKGVWTMEELAEALGTAAIHASKDVAIQRPLFELALNAAAQDFLLQA